MLLEPVNGYGLAPADLRSAPAKSNEQRGANHITNFCRNCDNPETNAEKENGIATRIYVFDFHYFFNIAIRL